MIAARHLSRAFGQRSAVEDVTFDVGPGEIFGLLGPNGAGKTTTLRMVAGLIAPTSGEASVAGVPLTRQTIDKVRGQVGFLTEAPGLWDRLTVEVNLLTYARLHQLPDPHAVVTRALSATPEEVRLVTDRARQRWEDEFSPRAGRSRVERLLADLGMS